MKKRAIMLLLAVLLLSGCNNTPTPASTPGSTSSTSSTVTSVLSSVKSRQLVDQEGSTVTVPEKVNSIICSINPMVQIAFAVGAQEQIIGTDTGSYQSSFLQSIYPDIAIAKGLGNKQAGFNPEEFAVLKPDVVFFHSSSGSDETVQQLRSLKVPTVVLIPETRDDMLAACTLVGDIVGNQDQAAKIVTEFERLEKLVQERLKNIATTDRIKVYMTGSQTLTSQTGDRYQHYLIEAAGGINVGAELNGSTVAISPEQILTWNPDIIFSIAGNPDSAAAIIGNPQLAPVKAIQDERVYKVPSAVQGSWDYPEPRSVCAIVWMASLMYPEYMADIDVLQIVNDYHQLMYGKTYIELGGSAEELAGK